MQLGALSVVVADKSVIMRDFNTVQWSTKAEDMKQEQEAERNMAACSCVELQSTVWNRN